MNFAALKNTGFLSFGLITSPWGELLTTEWKAASAKKKSSTTLTKGRQKKSKVADVDIELTGSEVRAEAELG